MKSLQQYIVEGLLDDNFDVSAKDINPIMTFITKYKGTILRQTNQKASKQDFNDLYEFVSDESTMKKLGFSKQRTFTGTDPLIIVGEYEKESVIAIYLVNSPIKIKDPGYGLTWGDTIMITWDKNQAHIWCSDYDGGSFDKIKKVYQIPADYTQKIKEILR